MILSKRAFLALFAIIIIEGYVVLSSELLAIKVTIPYIGSGTDMVSIIIAAVLLPLSFGYYAGGQFRPYKNASGQIIRVRDKLARNILTASILLLFGLSYVPLSLFMETLIGEGITHRVLLATIYSALFLILPVFLLGQTIPLISNFFRREKLAEVTGKMLFFSTIGSFLGAIFSTLVLMATVGVHYTAALNFILLGGLFAVLGKRATLRAKTTMFAIVIMGIFFNLGDTLRMLDIVANNQYNVVYVKERPGTDLRVLSLNRNSDSLYSATTKEKHSYVQYIEDRLIYSRWNDAPPMNVLVIGAGGFTLGRDDDVNIYHYVDIDGQLKDIAEKYFLKDTLNINQIFHPVPAESFILEGTEKFDLIVLDAFQGDLTIPENLVTQDFFARLKTRLADNGIVVTNFIVNPAFGDAFSRNIDHTFRSIFPLVTREVVGNYNAWDPERKENVMYLAYNRKEAGKGKIYTDNKNTSYYDRPKD